MKEGLFNLKLEIIAAENHNLVRRARGKHVLNFGTEIAEELSALYFSGRDKCQWQLAPGSTKGYDIYSTMGKIEVKSVMSQARHIGNLRDKGESDQIVVIWFSENTLLRVERVMVYETNMILTLVSNAENKKGLLTHKIQKELYLAKVGVEITAQFQLVLDEVMNS
jgi:hypothetical protein